MTAMRAVVTINFSVGCDHVDNSRNIWKPWLGNDANKITAKLRSRCSRHSKSASNWRQPASYERTFSVDDLLMDGDLDCCLSVVIYRCKCGTALRRARLSRRRAAAAGLHSVKPLRCTTHWAASTWSHYAPLTSANHSYDATPRLYITTAQRNWKIQNKIAFSRYLM